MTIVKCEACGSKELTKYGNTYECAYCGSKYLLDADENIVSKELTEARMIALLERSKQLHEADKYSEELDVLIEALEMDDTNSGVIVKLGRCYRCLNLPDKAMECYKRTIELNPAMGTAYTNMGTISILRENYAEALGYYEKGLPLIDKADYDYWVANANYAICVAKLGDPKRAEELIKASEAHGYPKGQAVRRMAGIEHKSFVTKLRDLFS